MLSSSTISESDTDSSSESSASAKSLSDKPVIQQIVRRKSQTKSTPATTESDKEEEEEEDDDEEDTPRKHVTRSSSAKTKRGSLLGIQKGTESDSENNGKGELLYIEVKLEGLLQFNIFSFFCF